jgi:hypothetical protein
MPLSNFFLFLKKKQKKTHFLNVFFFSLCFVQLNRTTHLRRDEAMASEEGGQQVGSLSRSREGTSRQFGDCSAQRNIWRPLARQQRILRL